MPPPSSSSPHLGGMAPEWLSCQAPQRIDRAAWETKRTPQGRRPVAEEGLRVLEGKNLGDFAPVRRTDGETDGRRNSTQVIAHDSSRFASASAAADAASATAIAASAFYTSSGILSGRWYRCPPYQVRLAPVPSTGGVRTKYGGQPYQVRPIFVPSTGLLHPRFLKTVPWYGDPSDLGQL